MNNYVILRVYVVRIFAKINLEGPERPYFFCFNTVKNVIFLFGWSRHYKNLSL